MLFSTVLTWLLIAVAFVVALPALWLLARGLWPEKVEKQRLVAGRGLLKSFLIGLAPLIGGIFLITIISKIPKMGALSVLVGGALLAWGFVGAGGIAALVGERLWPQVEPWRQTKHGGLTLICCALLPVVGWAVLLPLLAILGWGINVRTWFLRAEKPADATVVSRDLLSPEMPAA
jgi:hypothetical protein